MRGGHELCFQVIDVAEEPDVLATIAFLDEGLHGGALKSFVGDGADDRQLYAVVHELLNDCTGKTCSQLEEGRGEPDGWEHDQFGILA